MVKKIIVFSFIVMYSCLVAKAQSKSPIKFDHLTVDDGLSSNRAYSILQDKDGFMWIATNNGLNRYDGYQFKKYNHDTNNKYTINANEVYTLYEDSKHILWIGTSGAGICRYDKLKDRFIRYPSLSKYNIRNILEDDQKNLWVFGEGCIGKLDKETGNFENLAQSFPSKNIRSVCRAEKPDEFWVSTTDEGIYLLNAKTLTFKSYKPESNQPNSLSSVEVQKVYLDSKGILWIGTSEKGIDCFDTHTQTFKNYQHQANNPNSLPVNKVNAFLEVKGDMWVGTENGGLSVFDRNTQTFTNYVHQETDKNSISNNAVTANQGGMTIDKQGRIWICTIFGGVNIVDKYDEKFTKLPITLKNSVINTILKDSKQRLWLGTESGLVKIENGKVTPYLDCPVLCLAEDKNGKVWLGTWLNGISFYEEKADKFVQILHNPKNKDGIPANSVFWFRQSIDGLSLYMGTSAGLSVMALAPPNKFVNYDKSGCPAPDNIFYGLQVYEETPKQVWVASYNALMHHNLIDNQTTCYQTNADPKSISSNNVTSIFKDSKQRLWVGTNEGLNLMIEKGKFERFTTKNGLPSDAIKGILEDDRGYLWISTNKGISKFDTDKKTFRNYDVSDGLQSDEFVRNSSFKDSNGYLYFGGVKGLNVFHPDSIQDNPHIPQVHLTNLRIFNQIVYVGDADSLLKNDISQTKEITLTYQHSVFSIEFVALNLTSPEKNQYAYILEGLETKWNYVGTKRRGATYTNLDAGTYTFRVKASNNDELWNEEGTSLKIIVLPPWWKTWWFRTIVISLFLSGGIVFYRIRMNAVKKQNEKLQKTVEEKTKDIQQNMKELESAHKIMAEKQKVLQKLNSKLSANEAILKKSNDNLKEQKIEIQQKNEALQTAEEELRQNMEELEANQELLLQQKETIEFAFQQLSVQNTKVNDSIRYAQRIQNAILPHADTLMYAFTEHFIIFKPKDVVSGDFYWYLEIENKKFIAVVDCTGHGVPGAFMSMIGNTLLYEIINAKHIFEPHLILEELHLGILNALNRKDAEIQDGMDIALCCIEEAENGQVKVQYSGAKRPLYYFSKQELREVQANKKSIGQVQSVEKNYDLHTLILDKSDTLYMTTDGWIDAINPERKRFGSKQLKEMLLKGANLPLKAQEEVFRYILKDYGQGTEQRDDVLVVGVKV